MAEAGSENPDVGENPIFPYSKFRITDRIERSAKSDDDWASFFERIEWLSEALQREEGDSSETYLEKHSDLPPAALLSLTAEDALEELAARAQGGDEPAQKLLAETLLKALKDFEKLAWQELPGIVRTAQAWLAFPGLISKLKSTGDSNRKLLDKLGQGSKAQFPLPKGKKSPCLATPQNWLADNLYVTFEKLRTDPLKITALEYGNLHHLVKAMLELEPLTPSTADAWFELAWKVLEDASEDGNVSKWLHCSDILRSISHDDPRGKLKKAFKAKAEWLQSRQE